MKTQMKPKPPTLTRREREVLLLLAEGHSAKEVAARLYISKRTVDFHAQNMYAKWGVNNLCQMLNAARKAGLLDMAAEGGLNHG